MESQSRLSTGVRSEPQLGLVLCAAVVLCWAIQRFVPNPDGTQALAPDWLPLVAAGVAAAGLVPLAGSPLWVRVRLASRWSALLLMVWAGNGLPFDLLTMAGLIGHRSADGAIVLSTVYWPGLAMRTLALAAAIVLARVVLARPAGSAATRATMRYGIAAFLLALPYPLLRLHWALGGTIGLTWPGAAGQGWEPLIIAVPWVLAAVLSLLLAFSPRLLPRRLLLAAGWSATAIVAMIGPAAWWGFVAAFSSGIDMDNGGISAWVFGLFYGSWFLWAIAGGAATRSYQLRGAAP